MSVHYCGYEWLKRAYKLDLDSPNPVSKVGGAKSPDSRIFRSEYQPEDTLAGHLLFALKHENMNLGILKALFNACDKKELEQWISENPQGQQTRRTWFLYEWLTGKELNLPDADTKFRYVDALDEKSYYTADKINSPRHKVRNNMPGVPTFCWLVRKTAAMKAFDAKQLHKQMADAYSTHPMIGRAEAFLLTKDSQSSFEIEKEKFDNRAVRWMKTVRAFMGSRLDDAKLFEMQKQLVSNPDNGWRADFGWIGDRLPDATPLPEHISAHPESLKELMDAWLKAYSLMFERHPVAAATALAYGFIIIHPFTDGNGRIHRFILHQLGKVPVSSELLESIDDYIASLKKLSAPILDRSEWTVTADYNVELINDTTELYRYADATEQAEFIYKCIEQFVTHRLPLELEYLSAFDEAKRIIDDAHDMPDKDLTLLVNLCVQNEGVLSNKKRKLFEQLSDDNIAFAEKTVKEAFTDYFRMKG
ncbi:Fic family protein [Mariprofundus sp. KV]|uniref:Fic family protein n=1 Tax=Mariprofundus sp. KV TaxID=2608715 RepID=UPI0015A1CB7C|nr:Fic family protein [Mariprofundus sp. KV]NWF36016.1 Fic family protein [Mariprofundus sp. KV]